MGALSAGGLVQALSSFTTLVNTANTAFGAVRTLSGDNDFLRAQQDLALRQLQAQQGLAESKAAQRAAAEREALALQTAQADEQRRAALKRAVARQRAQFGAQGLDAGDGSGQAVLLGLFEESEQERRRREQMDSLKNSAIQTDLEQQKRLNVLQRTQLQEQQALQRAMRGY
jgi:hypothetical protein